MATSLTVNEPSAGVASLIGGRLRWRVWSSPADQPAWARPGLLGVAALAAVIFTWGAFHTGMNGFYASAARSMSMSVKNFVYGSFDPAGSITIDKLWGFLWPQALSARIFGFHEWSIALPVAVEGVVSVLVLYRVVRRWMGPQAGLLAAGIFTLTPVIAAVFGRSGMEDNALTMCLVLATDGWQRAVTEARLRSLLWSGFWVGAAFQTKMVQAWAVLPVFLVVYLVCAPAPFLRRLWHTGVALAWTVAVSLSDMILVQLTPAADRPYVDGSASNNVFGMVFGYNFLDRFRSLGVSSGSTTQVPGSTDWRKLFESGFASQIGWLYPLAALALIAGIAARGRAPRTDPVRAGYLMWGGTVLLTGAAFSVGAVPHTHYTAVLAPGIAALSAAGIVLFARALRARELLGWGLAVSVALTVWWAWSMSSDFSGFLSWLTPPVVILGVAAVAVLAYGWLRDRTRTRLVTIGVAAGVLAMVGTPAAWSLSTFNSAYDGSDINASAGPVGMGAALGGGGGPGGARAGGGFGGGAAGGERGGFGGAPGGQGAQGFPGGGQGAGGGQELPGGAQLEELMQEYGFGDFGSVTGGRDTGALPGGGGGGGGAFGSTGALSGSEQALLSYLAKNRTGAKYLMAVEGATSAEPYVLAGASVLPIGGFSGSQPNVTLAQFQHLVATGQLHYAITGGGGFGGAFGGSGQGTTQSINSWVTSACHTVTVTGYTGTLYRCG